MMLVASERHTMAIAVTLMALVLAAGVSAQSVPAPRRSPSPKPLISAPRPPAPRSAPRPAPRPASANGTCQDLSSVCKAYAGLGYCTTRPVWMVGTPKAPGNCLASCNKCSNASSPAPRPASRAPLPAPPGKPSNSTCRDLSTLCTSYTALGYCTTRPVWMVGTPKAPGNCLASCKKCSTAPAPVPRPSPRLPTPAPLGQPTTGNTTIISSGRSSFCLQPNPVGGRTAVMATCDGSAKQLWTWSSVDKTLLSVGTGLCLTYAAALGNGSAVSLQACTRPVNKLQQWTYAPTALGLITPALGKTWCLHVNNYSVADGAGVKMWSCYTAQFDQALGVFFLWGLYPYKCTDLDPKCPALAKAGKCASDAFNMLGDATHLGKCLVSCKACPALPPPSPPPPPPRPPSTMRPPRNGGAQGGQCVTQCPNGYSASSGMCVRPSSSYFKGCGCVWGICCNVCPGGWSESTFYCSIGADSTPLCASPPPPPRLSPPPSPPLPSTDPRYLKTLWRYYVDEAGVVRPGWKTNGLTYTDGNVFLATMIMTQMPQVYHETTDAQAALINQNCTNIMAPRGVVGPLQWWKVTWDRDSNGAARVVAGGARTARALVFRTNTDVFAWIPGTDAGAITVDLPSDPTEILRRLNAGSFGFGTGDWATNFEVAAYPTLSPIGVDIAKGFYDMFRFILVDELTARIKAKIQEIQPGWQPGQTTDVKVFFLGHSQGAAMAGLAAAYFFATGFPLGGAYLFADPAPTRFGDATYRNFFINNGLWNKVFRILNSNDVVPMLPPGNYHVGRTILFCQDNMLQWDDYGKGSPTCSADIGAVVLPHGDGFDYIKSLADFVSSIKTIIDNFSSMFTLHKMVFYASNALRAFSKQTSADMVSLLSNNAWPRIWLTPFCLTSSHCTSQCGVLEVSSACGNGYVCGGNFQCYLPPPPPPPCTTWWGGPCF